MKGYRNIVFYSIDQKHNFIMKNWSFGECEVYELHNYLLSVSLMSENQSTRFHLSKEII